VVSPCWYSLSVGGPIQCPKTGTFTKLFSPPWDVLRLRVRTPSSPVPRCFPFCEVSKLDEDAVDVSFIVCFFWDSGVEREGG